MSTINPITTTNTNTNVTSLGGATQSSGKTSSTTNSLQDTFLQLLLANLKSQNPMEPMSNEQMVQQMTELNSLQELQKISLALKSMSKTNDFMSATGLVGKTVTYLDGDEKEQTGTVDSISINGDNVLLNVGSAEVSLSQIVSVTNPEEENV
jgi:flagellar basal-body rod modification protein FlgD